MNPSNDSGSLATDLAELRRLLGGDYWHENTKPAIATVRTLRHLLAAADRIAAAEAEVRRLRGCIAYAKDNPPSLEAVITVLDDALDGCTGADNVLEIRGRREIAEAERDELIDEIKGFVAENGALKAFKTWVHAWLDNHGVPKQFPDGPHTKEGCRIGDRLDWLWSGCSK